MRLTLSCVFTIVALAVNAAGAAPILPEKLMVVLPSLQQVEDWCYCEAGHVLQDSQNT